MEECDTQKAGGWPILVHLNNGRVFGCDFVVEAKGVVPNTEMLAGCTEIEVRHVYARIYLCVPVLAYACGSTRSCMRVPYTYV